MYGAVWKSFLEYFRAVLDPKNVGLDLVCVIENILMNKMTPFVKQVISAIIGLYLTFSACFVKKAVNIPIRQFDNCGRQDHP